jgi:hypothetical protein
MAANYGVLTLVQPESIEGGSSMLSVTKLATEEVMKRGFFFPPLPQQSYQGTLPPNVVQLSDEQLGVLLNEVATWASYAETQLSLAKQSHNESEARLDFIRSRIRLGLKASEEHRKLSNPDKDDFVNTDPRVLMAQREFLFCQAVHDYTKQLVNAAQRDWETISRRITQRGQEIDRNRRGDSVGSVPVMSSAFRR